MTQPQPTRLLRVLQQLFVAQARDVMAKVSLNRDVPDLTMWVKIMAEMSKPVLLQLHQQGMVTSAARIAAQVGVEPNIVTTPAQAVVPRTDEGLRRYTPGNDAIFGVPKSISRSGRPWIAVGPWLAPILLLKSNRRLVCKAKGKRATLNIDLDLFSPRVLDAVDQAAFSFCRETMETATSELSAALGDLRTLLREGLPRGDAIQLLAKNVREIFADPARAFRIATTETSRAMHGGQLMAAKESGVVTKKQWLASSDACERFLKLDGKQVKLDKPFVVTQDKAPYNVVMFPPLHPHCFCDFTEVIE